MYYSVIIIIFFHHLSRVYIYKDAHIGNDERL